MKLWEAGGGKWHLRGCYRSSNEIGVTIIIDRCRRIENVVPGVRWDDRPVGVLLAVGRRNDAAKNGADDVIVFYFQGEGNAVGV
jgi:hypothetical protein